MGFQMPEEFFEDPSESTKQNIYTKHKAFAVKNNWPSLWLLQAEGRSEAGSRWAPSKPTEQFWFESWLHTPTLGNNGMLPISAIGSPHSRWVGLTFGGWGSAERSPLQQLQSFSECSQNHLYSLLCESGAQAYPQDVVAQHGGSHVQPVTTRGQRQPKHGQPSWFITMAQSSRDTALGPRLVKTQ